MTRSKIVSLVFAAAVCAVFLMYSGITADATPPAPSGGSVAAPHISKAREELKAAKKALGDNYNCCIEPECDFCALSIEKCPCADNLSKGKEICGNCYDGWKAGKGQLKNVDISKIKTLSADQAKMMFEKRGK